MPPSKTLLVGTRPVRQVPLEQLDGLVDRALAISLDDKQLAEIDEIFPGHRTAPEDYAW